MSILKIRKYPDPILTTKCEDIQLSPFFYLNFTKDMIDTMLDANGVGLAAPQVGESLNIFVARTEKLGIEIFINPTRLMLYSPIEIQEEGCLSLPGEIYKVPRAKYISINYTDISNIQRFETFSDLDARIIQHEYDHLIGQMINSYEQN